MLSVLAFLTYAANQSVKHLDFLDDCWAEIARNDKVWFVSIFDLFSLVKFLFKSPLKFKNNDNIDFRAS